MGLVLEGTYLHSALRAHIHQSRGEDHEKSLMYIDAIKMPTSEDRYFGEEVGVF